MNKQEPVKIYKPDYMSITNNRSTNAYKVKVDTLVDYLNKQLTMEAIGAKTKNIRRQFRRWLKQNAQLDTSGNCRNLLWNYEINDGEGYTFEDLRRNIKMMFRDRVVYVLKDRVKARLDKTARAVRNYGRLNEKDKYDGRCALEMTEVYDDTKLTIHLPRPLSYIESKHIQTKIEDVLQGINLEQKHREKNDYGAWDSYSWYKSVADKFVDKLNWDPNKGGK